MIKQLPQSHYFDIEVSIWKNVFHVQGPIKATLGSFLSGQFFNDNATRFNFRELEWVFKERQDGKKYIDRKFYDPIRQMLDGCDLLTAATRLREYVTKNGKDEFVDEIKKLFYGVTVSASFDSYRNKGGCKSITKLVALDIDNVSDINSTILKLSEMNLCLWIDKSLTGTGVFCIVPIECSLGDEREIKQHFDALKNQLEQQDIHIDNLKDVTRLRFWCPPDDAIINIDVTPYSEKFIQPEEMETFYGKKKNGMVAFGVTNKYDTTDYWQSCHRKGLRSAAKNLSMPEGEFNELNPFLKYYLWAFNHYGLSMRYVAHMCYDTFLKSHPAILSEERYSKERIFDDIAHFYHTYRKQHHILDFDKQKEAYSTVEVYDLEQTLPYSIKLTSLPELPNIHVRDGRDVSHWSSWNKYILDSPTNSGKTTTYTKYFLENAQKVKQNIVAIKRKFRLLEIEHGGILSQQDIKDRERAIDMAKRGTVKGLIVVPTQGALEQLHSDFPEIKLFYQKSRDVCEDDIVIATTYASFKNLFYKHKINDRFMVVDEFHNVVLSSHKGFRNTELNFIFDQLNSFDKVVLMTGTYLKCHHPILQDFKKLKVSFNHDITKELQIVYFNKRNRFSAVVEKILKTGEETLQVIYLDNKDLSEDLGKVIEALKSVGYIDEQIGLANADQKCNKAYTRMILTGKVNPNVKILIVTKIFVEALNLYDNVSAFHILTPIHGAYMQQLVTRPRKNKSCTVYLYWNASCRTSQDPTYWFDSERNFEIQKLNAESIKYTFEVSEWDKIHLKTLDAHSTVRIKKSFKLVKDDLIEPAFSFEIDWLNCDYNVQNLQLQNYRINPKQLYEYLEKYNWSFLPEHVSVAAADSLDEKIFQQRRKEKNKRIEHFIAQLTTEDAAENDYYLKEKKYDLSVPQWEIEVRRRYFQLYNMVELADAKYLISLCRDEKRAFDTIIRQLRIREVIKSTRIDGRRYAEKIFREFPIDSKWTSEQILTKMGSIDESSFPNKMEIRTKVKANLVLQDYVELIRTKIVNPDPKAVPQKGKKIAYMHVLHVVSHNPLKGANGQPLEPAYDFEERMANARINSAKRKDPFMEVLNDHILQKTLEWQEAGYWPKPEGLED